MGLLMPYLHYNKHGSIENIKIEILRGRLKMILEIFYSLRSGRWGHRPRGESNKNSLCRSRQITSAEIYTVQILITQSPCRILKLSFYFRKAYVKSSPFWLISRISKSNLQILTSSVQFSNLLIIVLKRLGG